MSIWLKETKELINSSIDDVTSIKYESLVFIFYEHLSNRNLAILISSLFDLDEIDIYFKIDDIISAELNYDFDEINIIEGNLNKNGFKNWIED